MTNRRCGLKLLEIMLIDTFPLDAATVSRASPKEYA
jgi:hypothetical protein